MYPVTDGNEILFPHKTYNSIVTQIHYDNNATTQSELLQHLIAIEQNIPSDLTDLTFPGRKITFPIVLDDPWSKDATERYMRSIREKAVYLPSNIEYLASNNGLSGSAEALQKLVSSDWVSMTRPVSYFPHLVTDYIWSGILLSLPISCTRTLLILSAMRSPLRPPDQSS